MTPLARAVATEIVRATPPTGVSLASLFGFITLPGLGQFLVCIATLAFIGMQAAYLRWKWNRDKAAAAKQPPTVPANTVPPPQ